MAKKKAVFISGGCVLLLGIVTLATYEISRIPPNFEKLPDEKVLKYLQSEKVKNLSKEKLVELGERLEKIPPEQRRSLTDSLPEEDRRNLWQNRRLVSEAVLDKTIDEFFSLPPDKQDEFLDRQIQQMEERRPRFGNRPGPDRANFPGFGNTSGTTRPETGLARGDFRRTGRGRPSPEAMLQRRRNMLSATTPEQRAKRREYFRRLMERRRQRRA